MRMRDFLHDDKKRTHPHLFMLQELKNDVPEIFKVHLLLCLGLIRGRCYSGRPIRIRRNRCSTIRPVGIFRCPIPYARIPLFLKQCGGGLDFSKFLAEGLRNNGERRLLLTGVWGSSPHLVAGPKLGLLVLEILDVGFEGSTSRRGLCQLCLQSILSSSWLV